jgi:hypothetical protein
MKKAYLIFFHLPLLAISFAVARIIPQGMVEADLLNHPYHRFRQPTDGLLRCRENKEPDLGATFSGKPVTIRMIICGVRYDSLRKGIPEPFFTPVMR